MSNTLKSITLPGDGTIIIGCDVPGEGPAFETFVVNKDFNIAELAVLANIRTAALRAFAAKHNVPQTVTIADLDAQIAGKRAMLASLDQALADKLAPVP